MLGIDDEIYMLFLVYNCRKVFKKFRFELSDTLIRDLANAKHGTIELLLRMLKRRIERAEWEMKRTSQQRPHGGRRNENDQPEADQYMGMHAMSILNSLRANTSR